MNWNLIFLVLLFVIIIRAVRRQFLRNVRIVIVSAVLLGLGYYVGSLFVPYGAPPVVKFIGAGVFLVEGLPEVLKYLDNISSSGQRQ